jgi:hypothetical protein
LRFAAQVMLPRVCDMTLRVRLEDPVLLKWIYRLFPAGRFTKTLVCSGSFLPFFHAGLLSAFFVFGLFLPALVPNYALLGEL